MREQIRALVDRPAFTTTVTILIVLNAIVLGLQTIPAVNDVYGPWLAVVDSVILWIFVAEIALRLVAYGRSFFRDGWSIFDFVVVAASLSSLVGLSALRAFRVFRVMRMLNAFPSLRRVISALLGALPGVTSVAGILLIILFVASVIATKLFAPGVPKLFGDLFTSMFTLFQVMTLEGWPEVARATLAVYPYAWIFFVAYIFIGTLTMLNLFVAIIVGAMEDDTRARQADRAGQDAILAELKALRAQVERLDRRS